MDHNYLRKLRQSMVADLEWKIRDGETISQAKESVLASTKLRINIIAKKDLLRFFDSIRIEHLSRQTQKADNLYSRYPGFRSKGRTPTLFERFWLQLFS